ncbi:MAG: helix-turn-helix domain-containing protein [Finegoldia sp.]|nr:helix-turn-helix domain-containing protein [Finegoldia sp.]
MEEKTIMTEEEVKKYLNVSEGTLSNFRKEGLRSSKVGKKRFYLFENIIKFMKEREFVG